MIIKAEDLRHYDFALTDINVIYRRPTYRNITLKSRRFSGFIYVINGECDFLHNGEHIVICPGALIYLPSGSHHTMTVTSEKVEFYRIDFSIAVNGERVLFSDCPLKLADMVDEKCHKAILQLERECVYGNSKIVRIEKLCTILSQLSNNSSPPLCSKLTPAIRFIHSHFTEKMDFRKLASMCFLSTAQFYNSFQKNLGMTPLAYRDRLLLNRAKLLLESSDMTVTEISDTLGFTSVTYFSRFFKKHMGISPTEYSKQNKDL